MTLGTVTLTNGTALPPDYIVASKPMCRYGFYPKYTGSSAAGGNLASNYVCAAS